MNLRLPSLSTILTTVFGAGGPLMLIIGGLNLGSMTGSIDQIITGVGGVLTAVAANSVHSVSVAKAKAKIAAPKA